tara:strand:- start:1131 stop:1427 length:297 start_codon:yes stop_codon:yes gene_type:complete
MAEAGKTPYEIRLEILKLANEYVSGAFNQQKYWTEKQLVLFEDMTKSMNQEASQQMDSMTEHYQNTMAKMIKLVEAIPTQETILDAAKKFQDFVNQKK